MIDHAAQIAAMKGARVLPVIRRRRSIGRNIVGRIAIGKTIRHDQVDHILGRDALKVRRRVERQVRFEKGWWSDRRRSPRQGIVAGFGCRADSISQTDKYHA